MDWSDILETVKSNALMRLCKDLGIASECWDKRFTTDFKAQYCVKVWVESKNRPQWRRLDSEPFYKETGLVQDSPNQEQYNWPGKSEKQKPEQPKQRAQFAPKELLDTLYKAINGSKLVDKETGESMPIELLHKDAAKFVASHWTKALAGDKNKYHLSLQGLFARDSATELYASEAHAILWWLLGKDYQLSFDAPIVEPAGAEAVALYEYFAEVVK